MKNVEDVRFVFFLRLFAPIVKWTITTVLYSVILSSILGGGSILKFWHLDDRIKLADEESRKLIIENGTKVDDYESG